MTKLTVIYLVAVRKDYDEFLRKVSMRQASAWTFTTIAIGLEKINHTPYQQKTVDEMDFN